MLPKLNQLKIVFFGTDEFAVVVLEEFKKLGILPALIITTSDTRRGRGLVLTPPPVKLWAEANKIESLQPDNLENLAIKFDLGLVASYGKIIPKSLLDIPQHGILNLHPSLLPKYRGPTPIQSAILAGDAKTGISIMLVDEKLDHGPILKTQSISLKKQNYEALKKELAVLSARLSVEIIPLWLEGKIKAVPQNHRDTTYAKKFSKEDGRVDLNEAPENLDRKFRALTPWPGIYFFTEDGRRVKITAARLENGRFVISRVIPEGKKEMDYSDFLPRRK